MVLCHFLYRKLNIKDLGGGFSMNVNVLPHVHMWIRYTFVHMYTYVCVCSLTKVRTPLTIQQTF